MKALAAAACMLAWLTVALPVRADVSVGDLEVAGRALGFMQKPMSGKVRLGIVYAPASPRSLREAESLRDALEGGLKVGNLEFYPVMVAIDGAAHADVDLFFLTDFMPSGVPSLAAVSAARQIPCITTDVDEVKSGSCAMAVKSSPKVEIVVNRAAAKDSGVTFATVFRVMITEI